VTPVYPDDVTYRIDVGSQSQGDAPPGPLLVGSAAALVAAAGVALALLVGWRAGRRTVRAVVTGKLERLERQPADNPFAASEAARLAAEGPWRIVRTEREMAEDDRPRRWRLEIQFGSPRERQVVVDSAFVEQASDSLQVLPEGVFADAPQKTRRLVSQKAVMRSRGSLALGIAIACTVFAFLPMIGAVIAIVGFTSLGYAIWTIVTTKRAGRLSRLGIAAIPITLVGLLVSLAQLSVAGLLMLPWWFPFS
jgi:membrane protein DedA with SNARE-associated domain